VSSAESLTVKRREEAVMGNIVAWLSGRKTYILAILGALEGILQFVSAGDFSLTGFGGLIKTEWFMALVAALRAGITKSGPVPRR
jgi:hypothetical protein